MGAATTVSGIEIIWPNGKTERVTGLAADQAVIIEEGRGVVKATPLARGGR